MNGCVLGETLPASVKDSHDISEWLLETQGEDPTLSGAPRFMAIVAGDPKAPTLNYTHCVAAAGHDTAWRFAENVTYEFAKVASVGEEDARFYATAAGKFILIIVWAILLMTCFVYRIRGSGAGTVRQRTDHVPP